MTPDNDTVERWYPCCSHCMCLTKIGHDETCIHGCNSSDSGVRPQDETVELDCSVVLRMTDPRSPSLRRTMKATFRREGDKLVNVTPIAIPAALAENLSEVEVSVSGGPLSA